MNTPAPRLRIYFSVFGFMFLGVFLSIWSYRIYIKDIETTASKTLQACNKLNCGHDHIVAKGKGDKVKEKFEILASQKEISQNLASALMQDLTKNRNLESAKRLAQQWVPTMKQMIQDDPDLAYQYALSSEDWNRLPDEVKTLLGRRIAEKAFFSASTSCETNERYLSYKSESIGTALVSVGEKVKTSDGVFIANMKGVTIDNYMGIVAMEGGATYDPSVPLAPSQPAFEGYSYTPLGNYFLPKLGTLKALYIIVKFTDETVYPASIANASLHMTKAAALMKKYSYGKLDMIYDVVEVAIPSPSTVDDLTFLRQSVEEVFKLGYNPDNYDTILRRNSNRGNYAWFDTKDILLKRDNDDTNLHEIGHNLGLQHANYWKPSSGQPAYGSGTNVIYEEDWDAMANAPRGDFNAAEKMKLGWLALGTDYVNSVASGVYRLYAYDSYNAVFNTAGVNGAYYSISIFKDTAAVNGQAADREYVLSFRNQPEWSSTSYNPWFQEGVLLHWRPWINTGSNGPFGTALIDANVASNTGGALGLYQTGKTASEQYDAPVLIGKTYLDNASGNRDGDIYITPLRKVNPDGIARNGDEYMDVKVVIGKQTINQSPTAAWTISKTEVLRGESVSFTVTASDPDDAQLGYFWDFGLGPDGLSRIKMPLNGLPNQTFTYTVAGSYVVSCTVTDGRGKTVTLSQSINVVTNYPPVVNAGSDQSVTIVASVPWSPTALAPQLWLDGSTATNNAGTISIVNAGSGGGTVSGPAALAAGGIGTLQAVQFSGGIRYLTGNYINTGTTLSAFFVGKSLNTSQSAYAGMMSVWANGQASDFNNLGSSVLFNQNNTTVNSFQTHRNVALSTTTGTLTAGFLAGTVFDGATNTAYLNGTAATAVASSGNFNAGKVVLGARWQTSAFKVSWNGNFGEAIICNANVSAPDRQKVEGYLAHKWGIAGSLAAGHPHKVAPPSVGPVAVATLDGTATDVDALTYAWSVVSGPASVTFANPTAIDTSATFSSAGVYTLRLTANDGLAQASDDIVITVNEQWTIANTFADWITSFAGLGGLTTFSNDADGDGVANGLEAFFGTAPNAPSEGLSGMVMIGNSLTFTHPEADPPLSNVTGSYEWSLNLSAWNASGVTIDGTTVTIVAVKNTPVSGTTTVTATVTGTQRDKVFVRAIVRLN